MHYGGRFGSHAPAWMRAGLCLCTNGAYVAASLAQIVTDATKSVSFAMQRRARAAKARRFRPSRGKRARATAPMEARLDFSPEAPVGKHGSSPPEGGRPGACYVFQFSALMCDRDVVHGER